MLAKPLTNLTKKDVLFNWTKECTDALKTLILKVTSADTDEIFTHCHRLAGVASYVLAIQLADARKPAPESYYKRGTLSPVSERTARHRVRRQLPLMQCSQQIEVLA